MKRKHLDAIWQRVKPLKAKKDRTKAEDERLKDTHDMIAYVNQKLSALESIAKLPGQHPKLKPTQVIALMVALAKREAEWDA